MHEFTVHYFCFITKYQFKYHVKETHTNLIEQEIFKETLYQEKNNYNNNKKERNVHVWDLLTSIGSLEPQKILLDSATTFVKNKNKPPLFF